MGRALRALPLASAVVRCALRRVTGWAVAAPGLALLACLVLAALPVALVRAGAAVGDLLGPGLGDLAVARAALVGAALPCLAAGVAIAASRADRPSLAPEHAVAPATRPDRILAGTAVPAVVVLVLAVPSATALVAPVAAASPGGVAAAPAALAAFACAVLAGGALASAWRRVACGAVRDVAGGLVLAVGSLGAAGPVEPAARALAGATAAPAAAAASLLACVLAAIAWGCLAEHGHARVRTLRRTSVRIPSPRGLACGRAALALLGRRRDCRAACAGAVALGLGAVGVTVVGRAPAPTGLLLAASGAAVCLAPVGLAVTGAILEGRAAWGVAPVRPSTVVLGWAAGSALIVAGATTAALAPALALERPPVSTLAVSVALGVAAWACALAAGALVPWRAHGAIDQAASLAVFGLTGAAASVAASRIGPALAAHGLGDTASAALLVGLGAAAAITLATRRVGRVG